MSNPFDVVQNPTESQILKYILIKKGYFTGKEYVENKKELTDKLNKEALEGQKAFEKCLRDLVNNMK